MPWQEHDQPSLFSLCHMELSICSKQTHPRLLRLASESCIFGRMCVCIVQWERSWKNLIPTSKVCLTSWLAKMGVTSRGADHWIILSKWLLKNTVEFFTGMSSSWWFCFLLLQSEVEGGTPSHSECLIGIIGYVVGSNHQGTSQLCHRIYVVYRGIP